MRAASVFTPRSTSQHSNGERIAPAAFCRNASLSACSCLAQTTTPPRPSLCPFRNFVVECTTMSAPSASGCWKYGDMKVLSTTSATFFRRQICADRRQIAQPHQRIRRRLHIHHPRVLADGAFDVLRVGSIDVRKFQPKSGHHLVEQPRRSAVQIVAAHHVVARLQHAHDGIDRRHAAGKDARRHSAFERCQILFQPRARGIRHARIFISFVLADSLLNVGRSRIDGNGDRARSKDRAPAHSEWRAWQNLVLYFFSCVLTLSF